MEPSVPGPEVVSSNPAEGATGVAYGDLSMTVTFDASVMCPTAQQGRITIDGDAEISKVEAYSKVVTVQLSDLQPLSTYKVSFPKGTVIGYSENQAEAFSISFTTKDKVQEPEPSQDYELNPVASLVNPNATKEAKNVYEFLKEQSGKKTLSGVQSSMSNTNDFIDLVHSKTGKHPALAGYDFIFLHYSPTPDGWSWVQNYGDISAAQEQWQNNGLVSYMWHWNVPESESVWEHAKENYGEFDGYAFYSDQTSFDIKEALKEGTWQNQVIMADIEKVAGYLKLLQDEGIPVIWRPLHEAAGNYDKYGPNGAWFWWGRGGAEPCKQLWRLLYDRFVNVHKLNNLIWVWTVDVTEGCENQYADWYPGDEYVDILGVDIYETNTDAKTRQYQAMVNMTKGRKLVTVSECGNIPDPVKCINAGNKWSWFMVWPNTDADGNLVLTPGDNNFKLNTEAYWKQVMASPVTLNREAMPSLK